MRDGATARGKRYHGERFAGLDVEADGDGAGCTARVTCGRGQELARLDVGDGERYIVPGELE